jgi:hypothetical protein
VNNLKKYAAYAATALSLFAFLLVGTTKFLIGNPEVPEELKK